MPIHNAGYQHWQGQHLGIWRRRATIAANGIHGCLQSKWMRQLILLCWTIGLAQVVLLFGVGQLLVKDSLIVRWVGLLGADLQMFARGLTVWIDQHPEISVRCTQNLLFYFFSTSQLGLVFVAMALAIPHLISRDLGSNAIVIYASKAISRTDYLLGKLGTVFGLLCLTWIGPLLTAWGLGNLMAPHWHFFWHSRSALGNLLGFTFIASAILGILVLGVSAISGRDKVAVSVWIGIWMAGKLYLPLAEHSRPWLKHLSLSYDLDQICLGVFGLGQDLALARDNIPVIGSMIHGLNAQLLYRLNHPSLWGSCIALTVMLALCGAIVMKKVHPQ
jgi:ABC-2 type transport system permease protein